MVVMKNCEPLLCSGLDACHMQGPARNSRVGASVGHGQQERLLMPELEVLIGEFLSVDGLPTGALRASAIIVHGVYAVSTHVATGEVSALKHEVGDDAVELGAGVAKALLAGGEGAEVLYSLGHDIVEELKVDSALLCCACVSIQLSGGAEQRTLDAALGCDIARLVHLDLWAFPGDVKV